MITVFTSNPEMLVSRIKEKIDQGAIRTWRYDDDGDFTHTAEQWLVKAWLKPRIYSEHVTFSTVPSKTGGINRRVYAIYHGRFLEMLLAHFDDYFDRATVSALATSSDVIK